MRDSMGRLHSGKGHFSPDLRTTQFPYSLRSIPVLFEVDAVKIGQGPIKKDTERGLGLEVRSEGIIIKWDTSSSETKKHFDDLNLTGEGAICWQNFSNALSTDGLIEIINTSVSNFIKQAPLPGP
jgi:hypothetical protein